jgi:hypothetical protein
VPHSLKTVENDPEFMENYLNCLNGLKKTIIG